MGIIKRFLLNFNIFQTQQFFRFDGDYEYNNLLGGFFSFLIRIFLVVLFIVKLVEVFKYSNVLVTATTSYTINVVNTTLSPADPASPILFALEVYPQGSDLNNTALREQLIAWTLNTTNFSTRLEECTAGHWATAPNEYSEMMRAVDPSSLVYCLPSNFSHEISIEQDATLQIALAFRCGNSCSTVNFTSLLVRPIVLNKLINAQKNNEYITTFLEKRMYYPIDTQSNAFDTVLQYELAKYSISTDKSLLPFKITEVEDGFLMPSQPYVSYRPNIYDNFVFFRTLFMLRNEQYNYERSFTKIFDAVSLVGGLIPIFTVVFIWLNYYALARFEMTFIKRLHSDQKAHQYGVFYFFSKIVYQLLNFFNVNMEHWRETKEYHYMHKTVNQLIDIIYLHKRLQFMERALEVLLEDHQIKVLHLMRNKTFKEAEDTFKNYQMKDNLSKLIQKRQQQQSQEGDSQSPFNHFQREINLEPLPRPSFHQGQPPGSSKVLNTDNRYEAEVLPDNHLDLPRAPATAQQKGQQTYSSNDRERTSEDGLEAQRAQIKELQNAFECYGKLCMEAADQNTGYFSLISRQILDKLDQSDREVLDGLRLLLNKPNHDMIIARIIEQLAINEFNVEEQLGYSRARLGKTTSLVARSRMKKSQNTVENYFQKLIRSQIRPVRQQGNESDNA